MQKHSYSKQIFDIQTKALEFIKDELPEKGFHFCEGPEDEDVTEQPDFAYYTKHGYADRAYMVKVVRDGETIIVHGVEQEFMTECQMSIAELDPVEVAIIADRIAAYKFDNQ